MNWRFLIFLVCQCVGAWVGWSLSRPLSPATGALVGGLLGGVGWYTLDIARGVRLLRWLRIGDASDVAMRTGIWGEISDRVRRLIRTREQETRDCSNRLHDFLEALQASPNGVVLLDAEGQIEWFNHTAALHFGLDASRDLLQHFANLVRDPGFANYFAGRDFQKEALMPGRQSTPSRPVNLSVHLHPYGDGRLLLLSRDVTAVEQAEAMRRDFVANVSHEIRTPLTVLSGFVETLLTLSLEEEERTRYLSLMSQQATRMQTLVSDLLTLSRLEGSPLPGTAEWMHMPSLMRQLEVEGHALSSVLTAQTGQSQILNFDCQLQGEIAGSPHELLSALSNLVGNAIRYTPSNGEICAQVRVLSDGRAEFCVKDTGLGIAPEHLPRLTERFYRVDRSRSRDTGGTGLGLAIVKHVAQRHGAELKIESTPGKGSTFRVLFPASRVRLLTETPSSVVGRRAPENHEVFIPI